MLPIDASKRFRLFGFSHPRVQLCIHCVNWEQWFSAQVVCMCTLYTAVHRCDINARPIGSLWMLFFSSFWHKLNFIGCILVFPSRINSPHKHNSVHNGCGITSAMMYTPYSNTIYLHCTCSFIHMLSGLINIYSAIWLIYTYQKQYLFKWFKIIFFGA